MTGKSFMPWHTTFVTDITQNSLMRWTEMKTENRLKIVNGMKWGLLLVSVIYFTIYASYSFGYYRSQQKTKSLISMARNEIINCSVANVCRVKSLDMIIYPMAKSKSINK